MKKILNLSLFCLILGGCSFLPASFQIASWALDGVSLIATKKSLSDHGLSIVTQKDCAIWRGLTDGIICQEHIEPSTFIATQSKLKNGAGLIGKAKNKIASLYLKII